METGNIMDCVRAGDKLPLYTRRIAFFAAMIAFVLGLAGFTGWPEAGSCEPSDFFSALLLTFQLYVLNVGPNALCNSFTWLAAFLAPIATISALLTVFSRTLGTWWRRFRLSRKEPDVVFLGGGKSATAIALRKYPKQASGISKERDDVVFVDYSQAPLIREHLSRIDCNVCDWHGNALSGDVLKSTNTVKARQVWVLTGDDKRNIEIAQNLSIARASSKNRSTEDQLVMVNVYDQELIRDVSFAIDDLANIRFFSLTSLAARHLFLQYSPPLPKFHLKDGVRKCTPLHIAVVGDGDLVDALVEQAIVHLVYSDDPQDCIHITLMGNSASEHVKQLNQRLPAEADLHNDKAMSKLLPVVQLQGIDCVPSHIKPSDWQACQVGNPFAAVYVTAEVDLNTINWALRVASLRELEGAIQQTKIVACLSQASHEPAALDAEVTKQLPENFVQFRTYDCISPTDAYPGEAQDNDARLINLAYDVYDVKTFCDMPLNAAQIRAEEKWSGSTVDQPLEEMFRKSSRFAADHIYIKLAYLYPEHAHKEMAQLYEHVLSEIGSGPWSSAEDKPDEQLLQLMKLEHRRFVVERLVDGWLPTDVLVGDSEEVKREIRRKKELRLNDTLVPYSALPPEQEFKDRLIVECIPKILELRRSTNIDI